MKKCSIFYICSWLWFDWSFQKFHKIIKNILVSLFHWHILFVSLSLCLYHRCHDVMIQFLIFYYAFSYNAFKWDFFYFKYKMSIDDWPIIWFKTTKITTAKCTFQLIIYVLDTLLLPAVLFDRKKLILIKFSWDLLCVCDSLPLN